MVAAMMGDLEVLKELLSQVDSVYRNADAVTQNILKKFHLCILWSEELCENLVRGGHIQCLKWARSMGCPWNYNACIAAANLGGHVEVVEWMQREKSLSSQNIESNVY